MAVAIVQENAIGDAGARSRRTGIALMIAAVACFACLDATSKWLTHSLHPAQMVFVRYAGSLLLVAAIFNPRVSPGIWRTRRIGLQTGRALCLLGSTTCAFLAIRYLSLSQFTSISFGAPLIVALIAGPLLGEWVGRRRLAAIVVGLCGILIVSRPGPGMHPASILAVGTAAFNAVYVIATRRLAASNSSETTLFYTGLAGTLVSLPIAPFFWTNPADPLVWLGMAAMGAFGTAGHGLLIVANRYAPASVVAPFFYMQLLWATLLGIGVFGSYPDRWTLVGGGVVLASGLYLLARERVRRETRSVVSAR